MFSSCFLLSRAYVHHVSITSSCSLHRDAAKTVLNRTTAGGLALTSRNAQKEIKLSDEGQANIVKVMDIPGSGASVDLGLKGALYIDICS